jgi:hypothetical protein
MKSVEKELKNALKKRALGYSYEEKVSELRDVSDADGNPKKEMVVTKVVKKEVQPYTQAIKLLLENQQVQSEDIEAILKEKDRIIRDYLENLKG